MAEKPTGMFLMGVLLPLWFSLTACDRFASDELAPSESGKTPAQYQSLEWTDLMPDADLQALLNPPDYLFEIEEGSEEDQRMLEKLMSGKTEDLDRYQQALTSKDIRTELDGTDIRLAGYLVPLEFDSAEVVTQAFLVPYFGACIHVPPPPPNQMVLLNAREGLSLNDMYNPYWVSGELSAQLYENELGTSAYEMKVDDFELYRE